MGAGVLAGAVTGTTLVATGTLPQRPEPQLAVVSCYHDGRALGDVAAGQSLLVTGRNADATWLEVYLGVPGADRGWAPASALRFDASIDSLPVVDCVGFIPLASLGPPVTQGPTPTPTAVPSEAPSIVATVAPTASPSPAATPSPTPRPTRTVRPTATPLPPPPTIPPPTPSPTPAPTADVFAPSLSSPSITSPKAASGGSYFIGGCDPATATIQATASDPSGVSSVTLYYRVDPYDPDLSPLPLNSAPMANLGGGIYQYVLDPVDSWPGGELSLWVRATDALGNITAYVPFGNPYSTADVSLFWYPYCIE